MKIESNVEQAHFRLFDCKKSSKNIKGSSEIVNEIYVVSRCIYSTYLNKYDFRLLQRIMHITCCVSQTFEKLQHKFREKKNPNLRSMLLRIVCDNSTYNTHFVVFISFI